MNISHNVKIAGAAALGFMLFACSTPNAVTSGIVINRKHDPAHAKTKKVCTVKVKTICTKWVKKSDGWDDADYDLQLKNGKHTGWVEAHNATVFLTCEVNSRYPACTRGN